MNRERHRRVEEIFNEILELPDAVRAEHLQACCGDDEVLLREVASLIRASATERQRGQQYAARARANAGAAARGLRVGPYEIDRLLGRGGMGSVYLAHRIDGAYDQQLAIKLVDLPLTSDLFRERFRVEQQILADLVHPYIARLLDGGMSDGGELFLAMEYVDGITITEYCTRHELTVPQRLRLFMNVCVAVQFAHQHLVVHRDLKPDNILIAPDGTPRLLDFGTAKLLMPSPSPLAAGFTQHGIQPFTPNYASPEQILGEAVTTVSDVYSLGVLLYVLLAEVPPYTVQELSLGELIRVVCTLEPPAPSAAAAQAGVAARADADLDAIVLKAMRKEPQQRYASVEQLSADLDAYLSGRPVTARRGSYRYRALKFARRNRLPLAMATLLAISIIAGGVVVLLQSHRVNIERQRAEARSEDLRLLSGSLLSEIDEAIKELPGSTPVQRLLVNRVLQHLDRLSKDADGDAVTQRDLIAAYTRLGNLQGNPYEQNIGDPDGAQASLDKAIHLAASLKTVAPRDELILGALALAEQSRGEVLFGIGRTPDAIGYMRAAIADYGARDALPGAGSHELAEEASAVGALGDLLGQAGVANLGDQQGALAAYGDALAFSERALRLEPGFVRAQRGVAIDHLKIGNIWLATDPDRASAEYVRALEAWQSLPTDDQSSASTRRGIAQTHIKMAEAASAVDDFARALQELTLAAPTLEYLAKADADDSRVTYDLASFYVLESSTYADRREFGPALSGAEAQATARNAVERLRLAIPILERLAHLEPGNHSWLANLAYAEVRLGTLLQKYSLGSDGPPRAASGLAALLREAALPDANVDVLEFAVVAALEVLPAAQRDSRRTLNLAQRLVAANRRQNPANLSLLARALRADGRGDEAAATAREGLVLLPPVPADGQAPRLARELAKLAGNENL